jgi:hypothetical protein
MICEFCHGTGRVLVAKHEAPHVGGEMYATCSCVSEVFLPAGRPLPMAIRVAPGMSFGGYDAVPDRAGRRVG